MDDDTITILLVVLLGGAAVWYLLSRKADATAVAKEPCKVAGSYQGTGLSVPCSAVSDVVNAVGGGLQGLVDAIPGMGSDRPVSRADAVAKFNAAGKIYNPRQTWRMSEPLPANYVNAIPPANVPQDTAYIVPKPGTPSWTGIPPAPGTATAPRERGTWS